MIGVYIVGFVLVGFVMWCLCAVASDDDRQMEEMLREKKAKDEEALNKLD